MKTQKKIKIDNNKLYNLQQKITRIHKAIRDKNELIERHTKKVGLRQVEIIDGALCINKTPIKLKGVNIHEHLPDNGRAIDYATKEAQIATYRDFNEGACRTAGAFFIESGLCCKLKAVHVNGRPVLMDKIYLLWSAYSIQFFRSI